MTHFLSLPGSGKSQKHYLCVYGIDGTEQTATDRSAAQALLGVRHVPPRAGTGHPLGARRTRYAGPDADGRRQVAHLSDSGTGFGGRMHRGHPADRPDERPGRSAPQAGYPRSGDPFGPVGPTDRHRPGQLRLWRREIPLRRSRTARIRGLPSAGAANERIASRRR